MKNRVSATIVAGVLGGALMLTGCGSAGDQDQATPSSGSQHEGHGASHPTSSDSAMEHPMDGGPAPAGIKDASSPKYPVGTKVELTADHMEGMNGATATIVGAYDTYAYAVNFTLTTGGDPVKDHKWVVQEEIMDAGDQRLTDGTEVTLLAEHMEGMEDAKATIASSTDQTVYMVDYEANGMTMTNHKWLVEDEVRPVS